MMQTKIMLNNLAWWVYASVVVVFKTCKDVAYIMRQVDLMAWAGFGFWNMQNLDQGQEINAFPFD
jgi:hypothetical protein